MLFDNFRKNKLYMLGQHSEINCSPKTQFIYIYLYNQNMWESEHYFLKIHKWDATIRRDYYIHRSFFFLILSIPNHFSFPYCYRFIRFGFIPCNYFLGPWFLNSFESYLMKAINNLPKKYWYKSFLCNNVWAHPLTKIHW